MEIMDIPSDLINSWTSNFRNEVANGVKVYRGTTLDRIKIIVKAFECGTRHGRGQYKRELSALQKLGRHENIVYIYGKCMDDNLAYLVMQNISHGSLQTHICNVSWIAILKIVKGIATGLQHIHSFNLTHHDIKPDNIMIDSEFNAKIIDFGECVVTGSKAKGKLGFTTFYASKQHIIDDSTEATIDLFGFGVIILQLIMKMASPDSTGRKSGMPEIVRKARKKADEGKCIVHTTFTRAEGVDDSQAFMVTQMALSCLNGEVDLEEFITNCNTMLAQWDD